MDIRLPAACAALLFLSTAVAESEPTITVTATRTPLALEDALAPVIVIDGDALRRSATFDLAEALRLYAGIEIGRNGGPGQAASLFLRGTNSNHTQVLVDGVRMNPGTLGGAAIQHLRPADIERIEVVKGPRSTLYGTEAIGGVVNVITRRPTAPLRVDAELGGGAYGTRSAGAGVAARRGAWSGALRADALASDGFPPLAGSAIDRGHDNRTLHARLGHGDGDRRVELRHWSARGNTEYLDFFGNPADQDFDNRVHAAEARWTHGGHRTLLRLSRAADTIRQRQSPDFADTRRDTLDWQSDWRLSPRHELSTGAVLARERTRAEVFGAAFDERPRTEAGFVQWQYAGDMGRALLAARHSEHDAFGGHWSVNAEAGRALGPDWQLVAAVGTAFRAPDSTQRFGFAGNPALRPERSRNLELGLRGRLDDDSRLELQLYENRIDDLINFDGAANRLANLDRARIRGVELAYVRELARWRWRQSLVWQDPVDLASGEPLPRRARRSLQGALVYRAGAWELGGSVLATGPRKDSGFSPDTIGGYVLLNLSAQWQPSRRWGVDLRLENALDADYQTALGFAQAGRSAFVRLHYSD